MAFAFGAGLLTGVAGGPTLGTAAADGTALPAGWELCVLQGTSAPLTQDNVADLDGWQVQEGGSTNNTAAYNPFNTGRETDVTGTGLPTVASSGFPAFANWLSGCAATVATLLQPNMATITAALRAGNVSPSAAFLALVDQSQWCAPSPDGVPCYANAILGSAARPRGRGARWPRPRRLRERDIGPAELPDGHARPGRGQGRRHHQESATLRCAGRGITHAGQVRRLPAQVTEVRRR